MFHPSLVLLRMFLAWLSALEFCCMNRPHDGFELVYRFGAAVLYPIIERLPALGQRHFEQVVGLAFNHPFA